MSEFVVEIVTIDGIEPIEKADRLELAIIGGYRSVVPKGVYQATDVVIYVPEGAVVPSYILERENLIGKLAGAAKNRVKACKLRGQLSQGIVMNLTNYETELGEKFSETGITWRHEGMNVTEALGFLKYEPPLPRAFSGELKFMPGVPLKYDIENLKKYPRVLDPDEEVVITEKLHGTFCQIGWCADIEPDPELFGDGRVYISSKGLGGKGLVFKNNEANANNLYVRAMRECGLLEHMAEMAIYYGDSRLVIMGEVFGDVQDLKYGMGQGEIAFRVFDIYTEDSEDDNGFYNANDLHEAVLNMRKNMEINLDAVPFIAQGKLRDLDIPSLTRGNSTFDPKQIREGIVIKPATERTDRKLGRVLLKSVSEDYLLRKNEDATELS